MAFLFPIFKAKKGSLLFEKTTDVVRNARQLVYDTTDYKYHARITLMDNGSTRIRSTIFQTEIPEEITEETKEVVFIKFENIIRTDENLLRFDLHLDDIVEALQTIVRMRE